MRVYQLDKANTIEIYRPDSALTITAVTCRDAVSGASLASVASLTNDSTNVSCAAIAIGATSITASGLTRGYRYALVETGLPVVEIETISVTSTTAQLREPCPIAYSSSVKVKSLRSSCTWTPSSAGIGRAANIEWTLSDGSIYHDEALLVESIVNCPLRPADVVTRYPRTAYHEPEWQRRAAVGWQPQITEAWDRVRDDLYAAGIRLETVRNPASLRELTLAHVGMIMIDGGFDPLGYQDTSDARRQLLDKATAELNRVLAMGLNVDSLETGTEQPAQKRLSLGWEKTIEHTVRRQ